MVSHFHNKRNDRKGKTMKYLVTGGCGFVGSHLVDELLENGHYVVVIDDMSNGKITNLPVKIVNPTYATPSYQILKKWEDKLTIINIDINDISVSTDNSSEDNSLFSLDEPFDGIFHLATHIRSFSLQDPKRDIEVNCVGMISVLELARKHRAKVVFTSNSGIYGSGANVDETFSDNPLTPYDTNKLASEWYCKIYHNIYGVECATVRFATVYGERQVVNESLNCKPLVSTFVQNIVNNEQVIINSDGKQTRDLLYVKDAVQGVIKAMNSDVIDGSVCLISTHTETSVNEVFNIIKKLTGYTKEPIYNKALLGDIRRMCLNNSKAKKTIGFEPRYTSIEGIKRLVDYEKKKK